MTDKEAYDEAARELDKLKSFVSQPRCINCDRWSAGVCEAYGDVPESYWYKPNQCPEYMFKIPF